MNINEFGAITLTQKELFDAMYSGKIKNLKNIFLDENSTRSFNQAIRYNKDAFEPLVPYKELDESLEFFDEANQCSWFMPDNYINFPIVDWLYSQCTTNEQKDRVDKELTLFIQHGMFDLLFYLKYLVDKMRENDIVWGVGRGSSVASYTLYLIGVHKIDSIKYELDINEFLKGEQ